MAMKQGYILFFIFLCHNLFAQELKTFKVNPGQKVYDVIGPAERYTFPDFQLGGVFFKNNRLGTAKMNYNALLAAIEFIDEKGDTLTLDLLETIRFITIATDTFYFDKVVVKHIATAGNIRLASQTVIMVSNHQRIGAMGIPTDASVDAFTSLSSSGNPLKTLIADEVMTYKENIRYYFGNKFGQYRLANKKNLMAAFGNHRDEITRYLEVNMVDFYSEKQMREILLFLSKL
jgi:hypothetical protein